MKKKSKKKFKGYIRITGRACGKVRGFARQIKSVKPLELGDEGEDKY
jgi:hypothetical protein